ncbi:unnamed protein product, partial [Plutella xylostella]
MYTTQKQTIELTQKTYALTPAVISALKVNHLSLSIGSLLRFLRCIVLHISGGPRLTSRPHLTPGSHKN